MQGHASHLSCQKDEKENLPFHCNKTLFDTFGKVTLILWTTYVCLAIGLCIPLLEKCLSFNVLFGYGLHTRPKMKIC